MNTLNWVMNTLNWAMNTVFLCCDSCSDTAAWNGDVMCHVTRYCNMIGPHCTVQWYTACIHSSPDPSFFVFAEVGLVCETRLYVPHTNIDIMRKEMGAFLTLLTVSRPVSSWFQYVLVPWRTWRLFRLVFRLHRCVWSAVPLNFP